MWKQTEKVGIVQSGIAQSGEEKGGNKKEQERLFTRICCEKAFNLKEDKYTLDMRIILMRVVRSWHRLFTEIMDALSLEIFKSRLDGA